MKRFVSVALACLFVASMAACNSNGQSGGSVNVSGGDNAIANGEGLPVLSPDHPVNFTVFLPSDTLAPASDNKIARLLKDELGVTFTLDIVPSGSQEEKIGVMIAGGEYPDLIGSLDLNVRFAEAGALEPLDEYMTPELANNIQTFVEPYRKRMAYPKDGKVYLMPNYGRFYGDVTASTHWGAGFWIQKAVLAEFGYPEVTTLDEYFGLIEQYMEKYPTIDGQPTIGFEIIAAQNREFVIMNPPEHLTGHLNDGMVIVDDNVAQIFTDKDISKTYYKYLNDMNQKGLIDKEALRVFTYIYLMQHIDNHGK